MTALSSHPENGMDTITIQNLPADLSRELRRLAETNGRSLDAQIIHMLMGALALENRKARAEAFLREIQSDGARLAPTDPEELVAAIRAGRDDARPEDGKGC